MKKILLASCVAAISAGVNAELTPLSEYELHTVTGQAGIDLELDVGIEIGDIRYTDTAENGDGDGGSISIRNISIGGGEGLGNVVGLPGDTNTSRIDNFKFSIDIDENGDLDIAGKPANGGGVVDFLVTVDDVVLLDDQGDERATLVDGVSLYGGAAFFDLSVSNEERILPDSSLDEYTNIRIRTQFGIDDLDLDLTSSLGVKIEDAVIAGHEYFEQIEEDGSPTLTGRLATFRANIYEDSDGDGVYIDLGTTSSSTNIFDIDMKKVYVGGDLIGSVAIDDLDIRGVAFHVSGHN